MRLILFSVLSFIAAQSAIAQGCCSGGGGNPLAGGASTGVLQQGQMEVLSSYQYSRSNRFLSRDRDTVSFFDNLSSNYVFLKADYGVSDKFTMSVAAGYYINRTITEFADTTFVGPEMEIDQRKVSSSGIGDLILFPKYSVYNKTKGVNRTELSLGMGWKIPIGSHNDSNYVGQAYFVNFSTPTPFLDSSEIWQISPPTVQATTGSHDLMFYGFFFKNFPHRNMRLFASGLYVKKGWNSLGLKFGDYASLGLFAGTTIWKNLGLTAQIKGEWVGKMKTHALIDPLSAYNIDTTSTGSRMVSFVPQISYSFKGGVTLFALANIPMYQYLRGTQVASQYQLTGGISYRFFVKKKRTEPQIDVVPAVVVENMNQKTSFRVWGNCDMCEKTIESTLSKMDGVSFADWNLESQILILHYDEKTVNPDEVKLALAKIGYDTEAYRATNKAYDKLHACCKYEREIR